MSVVSQSRRWFMKAHAWVLRISNGRLGSRLGSQRILLLHTTGRKSGRERVIPIAYFSRGDQIGIVASNWGQERQAEWYLNLLANPKAVLQINGQTRDVVAHDAQNGEYEQWWAFVTERHGPYREYQAQTQRRIPIMIFDPVDPAHAPGLERRG